MSLTKMNPAACCSGSKESLNGRYAQRRRPGSQAAAKRREHADAARHHQRRQRHSRRWRNSSSAPRTPGSTALTAISIESFSGAGGEHVIPARSITAPTIRPCSLAPTRSTPVEFLLHGLAACITAGIGNIAAARGVTLTSVESHVEGDIDLRGILGLSARSGTATRRSARASPSRATHRPRSCGRSSSRRRRGRRSSTC